MAAKKKKKATKKTAKKTKKIARRPGGVKAAAAAATIKVGSRWVDKDTRAGERVVTIVSVGAKEVVYDSEYKNGLKSKATDFVKRFRPFVSVSDVAATTNIEDEPAATSTEAVNNGDGTTSIAMRSENGQDLRAAAVSVAESAAEGDGPEDPEGPNGDPGVEDDQENDGDVEDTEDEPEEDGGGADEQEELAAQDTEEHHGETVESDGAGG